MIDRTSEHPLHDDTTGESAAPWADELTDEVTGEVTHEVTGSLGAPERTDPGLRTGS